MKNLCKCAAVPSSALLPSNLNAHAAEANTDQEAELAKQLSNPVSSLIGVPFQANEDFNMGPTGEGGEGGEGYKFTPFLAYTTHTHTTFMLNSESTYDWKNSQWTAPIHHMLIQVLNIGKLPISVPLGGRYYVDGPSGAPDWGVRLTLTLLFPTAKHTPEPPSTYVK